MARFKIMQYIEDTNLLTVNWRWATLIAVIKEHKLRSGECVVFENVARNKARLVANFGGMPLLMIPPIDPKRQLTVHLEINRFLRSSDEVARVATVTSMLVERDVELQERIVLARAKAKARRRRAG